MKRILFIIAFISLTIQLSSQDKPEMFDFLAKFERQSSIEDFIYRYADNLHPMNEEVKSLNGLGIFMTDFFTFDSKPSLQMVAINPTSGSVVICALPDMTKIDSTQYSQASSEFKQYVIDHIGKPDLEDVNISENAEFLALFAQGNLSDGKRYLWENDKEEPEYAGFSFKSAGQEFFILMAMPPTVETQTGVQGAASKPIQRKFFNSLELGTFLPSQQLSSIFGVSNLKILNQRTSEGKSYQILYDGYFGGYKWTLVELNTCEDKLSKIMFTSSKDTDNKYIYENLLTTLTEKYGTPKEINEKTRGWIDAKTSITLYHDYARSEGGQRRYFVILSYVDMELHFKGNSKAVDEL